MTKCLLVPVDLSEASARVVQRAADVARATGAKLELLHVVTRHESLAGSGDPMAQLAKLAAPLRAAGVAIETHVVSGDPVAEILAALPRLRADSIVIGERGHCPTYERIVGSVTEGVLRAGRCPVEVVPIR